MKKTTITPLIALILLVATTFLVQISTVQATIGIHSDFPHAGVVVTEVMDGDTIRISPPVLVNGTYRSVVRLADIDTPETGTLEGDNAKQALRDLLVQHGGVVYLDIDKARGVDDYGRIIAVVYVRVSATHLLNVNKWLVDNGYASISDYTDNDFDPSKWSLYIEYPVENEKPPVLKRVVLASLPQGVSYGTSWGVRVAVTPDGNYIGVAFSEYNTYHLWVVILDKYGNIVRSVNLSDVAVQYGLANVTNVFRGMLTIAANNSGFLVAWTQYSAVIGSGSPRSRITLFTYIPIDRNQPIPYNISINQFFYLHNGTYQYHPHALWYCNGSDNCYWIIVYHYNQRTYSYAVAPDLTTRIPSGGYRLDLSTRTPSSDPTGIAVGIDVLSGVLYDPVTKKYIAVARNYTDTTGYDIELWTGSIDVQGGNLTVDRISVDNRQGDQGPMPEVYDTTSGGTTIYYSYNNVYPMYSALLASGGRALVVYNDTASSMVYTVVDLSSGNILRYTLLDYGNATIFYSWIAGGSDGWLLAYSARGYVNITLVGVDGSNTGLIALADQNSAYIRAAYDPASRLFPVVYAVKDLVTGNYNIHLVLYNETSKLLGRYVIPINNSGVVNVIPINIKVLPNGGSGIIVILTIEENTLVAYYLSSDYPKSQNPAPIPLPLETTTTPTITTTETSPNATTVTITFTETRTVTITLPGTTITTTNTITETATRIDTTTIVITEREIVTTTETVEKTNLRDLHSHRGKDNNSNHGIQRN